MTEMIKLNEPVTCKLKPVYHVMVHSGVYEGPCRWGDPKELSSESEAKAAEAGFSAFKHLVRSYVSPEVNILDPVCVYYTDDWNISDEELEKLQPEAEDFDAFLLDKGSSLAQYVAVILGTRFYKPIIFYCGEDGMANDNPTVPMAIDAISHLRYLNREGFLALNSAELDEIVSMLRIRKAVKQSRVLRVSTKRMSHVDGNFNNPDQYTDRYGLEFRDVSISQFQKVFIQVKSDEHAHVNAEQLAETLMKNAHKTYMNKEQMLPSIYFYFTVLRLMKEYRCNCFTANCLEICPDTRIASQIKAVPCLTHSLLRDSGFASSCEADLNALLAIIIVMQVAKKSVHMGNVYIKDYEQNLMYILHDVPCLKMRGFNTDDLPYEIKNFTSEGWGATLRYDYSRDLGENVNIMRFNPAGTKILVTKGSIAGSEDVATVGCSMKVLISVSDIKKYIHACENYGNHSLVVFGDYTDKMRTLGTYMGFEVEEV